MIHTLANSQPQRNEDQDELKNRVVSSEVMPLKDPPDAGVKANKPEMPAEKFEPTVGRNILWYETNLKI